ncbi:MAG: hypothetical protein PWR24_1024 [Desulfonauticus sp.]|nr:hypothetical protein [Desulfonauticus sp.]
MKILKDNSISLFIKSIKIKDKIYLVCSKFILFDLINPKNILTEQELWQKLPNTLKGNSILDMGIPKPRGELLLTGSCFSPKQKATPVLEVRVKVGNLNKTLTVFGDRYWKPSPLGWKISEPKPFTKMPISWKNAFGGKNYKKNPLGKGIDKVLLPDGKEVIPLPNVEYPNQLIVSIKDRPEPASFGPIDIMWPQRFNKQGTYDEKWLKEKWPYFPEDMNYDFFNMASEDQFLKEYFQGDEKITITNMHPDIPVIESKLPGLKIRCFVTKIKYSKQDTLEEFVEVKNNIDTLWLFPEIEKGLLIYRGLTEIQDEEFRDVKYIFLAQESLHEEPKPKSHYLEEQKKKINRAVDIDLSPFENAQKEIAKTLKKIKSLPKKIENAKLKAMGKAPKMTYTLDEIEEKKIQSIQQTRKQIDKLELLAQNMHTKWGHLVKIPLNAFDQLRENLDKTERKIHKIFSSIKQHKKNSLDQLEAIKESLKNKYKELPKEQLQHLDKELDLDHILEKKGPDDPWHKQGFPLVVFWRKNLEKNKDVKKILISMGFEKETIEKVWLGLNQEERKENLSNWNIKNKKEIIIPKGLVIPYFQEEKLIGFKVRSSDWASSYDEFLMPGSQFSPIFLPAVEKEKVPVIIIEDELAAYLLEQEVGDACTILALKDIEEIDKLDDTIKKAIDDAMLLIIAVPKNYSEHKLQVWRDKYPNIKTLPFTIGNNLFELPKNNIDIRTWVMEVMPEDFVKKHNININLPKPGKLSKDSLLKDFSLPTLDIKGIIKNFQTELKAFHQPKINDLASKKTKLEQEITKIKKDLEPKLKKMGLEPEKALNSKVPEPKDLAQQGKELAKIIKEQKEQLRSHNKLTPEIEAKLNTSAKQASLMGENAAKRYATEVDKLTKAKEKIANLKSGKTIEEFKDKLKTQGLNPDRLEPLTREQVIEKYQKDKNLSQTMLAGLDLSGLNLEGADFTEAICSNTNFTNCNLTKVTFNKTIVDKAIFSRANLEGSKIKKSILKYTNFENTSLKKCTIYMSIILETNFIKSNFASANIKMSSLQKAKLKDINFHQAKLSMNSISKSNVNNAIFLESKISKCIFQDNTLDNTNFSNISLDNTIFIKSKAKNILFIDSKLVNMRTAKDADFKNSNFTNSIIINGCFRETKLNSANFQGSTIESTIFEDCKLKESNFFCVPAKNSRFIKCDLEKANLRGINLFQGSLRKTRLVNTDLRDSNLFAVDFYKAIMGNTKISRANIKKTFLEGRIDLLQDGELSD